MTEVKDRVAYIAGELTINIVLDNQIRTIQIKSKPHRNGVVLALEKFKKSAQSSLDLEELEVFLAPIKRIVVESDKRFELDSSGKKLYLAGTKVPIPGKLGDKIMDFLENNLSVDPLVCFWESCLKNPHYVAINELFIFLEENHLPITEDGGFLGYKKLNFVRGQKHIDVPDEFEELILSEDGKTVSSITGAIVPQSIRKQYLRFVNEANNPDMVDVHSGKIHQKVGEFVRIERLKLNEWDRREECGYGLHIGAFSYSFSGNVRVLCKVMPEDVIAANEGQAKLRTCKYQIVSFVDSAKEIKELLVNMDSKEQDICNGDDDEEVIFEHAFGIEDEVECIDDNGVGDLIQTGLLYTIIDIDTTEILVVDENGDQTWFDHTRFQIN